MTGVSAPPYRRLRFLHFLQMRKADAVADAVADADADADTDAGADAGALVDADAP